MMKGAILSYILTWVICCSSALAKEANIVCETSVLCQNGAGCTETPGVGMGATCTCTLGFSGTFCQIGSPASSPAALKTKQTPTAGSCSTVNCKNGNCRVVGNGFVCDCFPGGWTGQFCGIKSFGVCATKRCLNSGTCTNIGNTGFQCACQAGFSGTLCEISTTTTISLNASPSKTSYAFGEQVAFTCTTTQSGVTSYALQRNGGQIQFGGVVAGQKTWSVTRILNLAGTSQYSCSATGLGVTSRSPSISITVNAQTTATTTLSATPPTVTVGSSVLLTCTTTLTGTITYKLLKNGVNVQQGTTASQTWTLSQLENTAGRFTYSCSATSAAGSATSPGVVITVNAQTGTTSLTASPTTVIVGSSVVLTCRTTLTGSITYKLLKNGVQVQQGTTASQTWTLSQLENTAGRFTYSCSATSAAGSATSPGVAITVNAQTTATTTLSATPKTVTVGSSVTFICTTTLTGSITYKLMRNGIDVPGQQGTQTSQTWTLLQVQNSAGGFTYTCSATSTGRSATSTGVFIIVNAVKSVTTTLTVNPSKTSYAVGDAVTFTCSTTQTGTTTYLLTKNGVLETSAQQAGQTWSVVRQFLAAGTFQYTCTAISTSASTSASTTVTVAAQTTATTTLSATPKTVPVGSSVLLTCTTTLTGTITYKLLKNGVQVQQGTTSSQTWTLSQLENTAGRFTYACSAVSSAGSATSPGVAITVNAMGTTPTTSLTASATSITVGSSVSYTCSTTQSGSKTFRLIQNGNTIVNTGVQSLQSWTVSQAFATAGPFSYTCSTTVGATTITSSPVAITVTAASVLCTGRNCNSGTCQVKNGAAVCVCKKGWIGVSCDKACIKGWVGVSCEKRDTCSFSGQSSLCQNRATCTNTMTSPFFTCACRSGYSGSFCQDVSVGASCRISENCKGLQGCAANHVGYCKLPQFQCHCKSVHKTKTCTKHADCSVKCITKRGLCLAKKTCRCFVDDQAMLFFMVINNYPTGPTFIQP